MTISVGVASRRMVLLVVVLLVVGLTGITAATAVRRPLHMSFQEEPVSIQATMPIETIETRRKRLTGIAVARHS